MRSDVLIKSDGMRVLAENLGIIKAYARRLAAARRFLEMP